MNSHGLEDRRLGIQAECDAAKDQPERNRLGQFATPTSLALEIARYGLRLLGSGGTINFLDPAAGTGAFFSALLKIAGPTSISRAVGFEIDPQYGNPARQLWSASGLEVRLEDFTKARPPERNGLKFNLTICNPPYVRHHHLSSAEKQRLREIARRATGAQINGLAGLYCYFLGAAHPWMAPNGIAGWLLPSEFMDVNYGLAVKDYLLSRVTLLRIHRFDPMDVQFGDALVSSAIVWFRNATPQENHSIELTFGGNLTSPISSHVISARQLRLEKKWTRLATHPVETKSAGPVLSEFFAIKRGLATGANEFFVLGPDQIKEHNLPKRFLFPILPGPRYMPCAEIQADDHGNPLLERKRFLLDCRLPEQQVRIQFPSLWTYYEKGRALGHADRYLCASRSPWYAQEIRSPAQFLCTYIGRSDTKTGRPFRFILNHSIATAANVYLLLYPKPELERALKANPALARTVWEKLNEIDASTMIGQGRVYGGGLHKLEPSELANVPAEAVANLLPVVYTLKPQQMLLCEKK